ncbi:hypothetical protein D3C87_1687070 [compost metagenome]
MHPAPDFSRHAENLREIGSPGHAVVCCFGVNGLPRFAKQLEGVEFHAGIQLLRKTRMRSVVHFPCELARLGQRLQQFIMFKLCDFCQAFGNQIAAPGVAAG